MNRREMVLGLGLAPFAWIKGSPCTQDIKGRVVYHIDVRDLPPDKATLFCQKVMEQRLKPSMADGWEYVLVPNRYEGNRVEVFAFMDGVEKEIIPVEWVYPHEEFNELDFDYLLLMCGSPGIPISELESEILSSAAGEMAAYGMPRDKIIEILSKLFHMINDILDEWRQQP